MSKMIWLTLVLGFLGARASAAADGDSFTTYDSIVSELKSDAEIDLKPKHESMDWESVAISGSLGVTGALVDVPNVGGNGGGGSGFLKGFEAAIGANTFSKQARAELAFRNYAGEKLSGGIHADMREFEARMIFLPPLRDDTRVRMGLGLSERILSATPERGKSVDRSGLYYGLMVGLEHQVSKAVSIGPDLAYRDSLNNRSDRKSSWDASFRLNANF
jgi:hypothetical protein